MPGILFCSQKQRACSDHTGHALPHHKIGPSRAAAMPQKTPPKSLTHHKMTIFRKIPQTKNTTPLVPKLDDSVVIRPKSPDVNSATRPDIKVVRNNSAVHSSLIFQNKIKK
jgi:hypothetical protein